MQSKKSQPQNPFSPSKELQLFLAGRSLLREELPFSPTIIETHLQQGYLQKQSGLEKIQSNWQCRRCGTQKPHRIGSYPCAVCKKTCYYCRHCLMMRRVASCSELFQWTGSPPTFITASKEMLQWEGTLSPGQQQASDSIVTRIAKAGKKAEKMLVWAVCGSGKTELLFAGIHTALQLGMRICIATPRTDVVLELVPRLQAAFPNTSIAALYGGSTDRDKFTSLTIATTHQLFRFANAFDVMIVDEVDAFPFSFDETLAFAVKKASKETTVTIYLTATPTSVWKRACRKGTASCITIPARFHKHPLPVPTLQWCGNWRKSLEKQRLPLNVKNWVLHRLKTKKQALLFFPSVASMQQALPYFQAIDPHIHLVYAEDPLRKEKVQKMRTKEIMILLTTTILERGVTFPNLDVAVIGAEKAIFTEAALVQIAGRVGRSAQYPFGTVTFFHHGRTKAMLAALSQIEGMNRQARRRGWLMND